jgi:RNA polymerase sigma factor (sigma-70 family)
MVAGLARRFGDLDLAEDCVQEAVAEALEHWPDDGYPPNPAGWLVTTATRKALDRLRREQLGARKLALLAATEPDDAPQPDDDRLALVFACCHPALPRDQQVALTLRTVCGLTTGEIAAAFLVGESAMAQRLVRAKRALRAAGARFAVPEPDELEDRLAEVLAVVYLVFNEGWLASSARVPERRDLVDQSVALADLLVRLMPREPEVLALRALIAFHQSRAATRFESWSQLVLLADQDRSRWDRRQIAAGTALLDRALAMRRPGAYQLQAAIAAIHATAPSWEETDWAQIRLLYSRLDDRTPSPVVRLNRAIATRYVHGVEAALAEVEREAAALDGYRLFHSTRAELLRAVGRTREAEAADRRAYELATNPAERDLLARRVSRESLGEPRSPNSG